MQKQTPKTKDADTQRTVACPACNNRFIFDTVTGMAPFLHTRAVEALTGVTEAGLVCPGCGAWYHISYTNALLESQRREAELTFHPTRRSALRGKYTRRFQRFQEQVRSALEKLAEKPDAA